MGSSRSNSALDESGNTISLSSYSRRMEARFQSDNPFGVEAFSRGGRPVKKIRELRGSLALNVGGPTEIVVVKNFLHKIRKNKSLGDAALKALGIVAKVDYQQHPDKEVAAAEVVSVELRWKQGAVVACEACDGEKMAVLTDGNTAVSSHGPRSVTWWHSFREPLPANAELRLCIQKNTRKVRVPFVLKDIEVKPMPKEQE